MHFSVHKGCAKASKTTAIVRIMLKLRDLYDVQKGMIIAFGPNVEAFPKRLSL